MSAPFRTLLCTAALLLAVPAAAQQTIGDIANQGRPAPGAQPAPSAQPAPAIRPGALPTIGDIAARGGQPQAPQARAGCTPPPLPADVPDGKSATEEQMRAAHAAFRGFVDGGQEFISCLDGAYQAGRDRITVGGYLALTEAHNRMVAVMEAVAERFNGELREYRAKGGK